MKIHIDWDGPYKWSDIKAGKALREPADYGVYQIYGGHPVYGGSALLYIGLAAEARFGDRISAEDRWPDNRDAGRIEVHVGRLLQPPIPSRDDWKQQIRLAERLLIYAHSPAMNTQKNLSTLEAHLRDVHVLNWGKHRDLLPEVSGARWSSLHDELKNIHCQEDAWNG